MVWFYLSTLNNTAGWFSWFESYAMPPFCCLETGTLVKLFSWRWKLHVLRGSFCLPCKEIFLVCIGWKMRCLWLVETCGSNDWLRDAVRNEVAYGWERRRLLLIDKCVALIGWNTWTHRGYHPNIRYISDIQGRFAMVDQKITMRLPSCDTLSWY